MPRCPVCQSFQVVIVVSSWPEASSGVPTRQPGNANCSHCGSRWVQRGSEQAAIRTIDDEPEAALGSWHPSRLGRSTRIPRTTYPHSCPICGIGLLRSDLDGPGEDYFCPYCSTKTTPAVSSTLESASAE